MKTPTYYDELANWFDALNDVDPISLEGIWEIRNNKKCLCKHVNPDQLFTYVTKIGDKSYVRCLFVKSMYGLLKCQGRVQPKDPFTNTNFSKSIIERANNVFKTLKIGNTKKTNKERIHMLIYDLVTLFGTHGYFIDMSWIKSMNSYKLEEWIKEMNNIWRIFRNDFPESATYLYSEQNLPQFNTKTLSNQIEMFTWIIEFGKRNPMGVELIIKALAWTNQSIRNAYPYLIQS